MEGLTLNQRRTLRDVDVCVYVRINRAFCTRAQHQVPALWMRFL